MTWQKGQSGNPAGRTTDKALTAALRIELREAGKDGLTRSRRVVRKLLKVAEEGNVTAIQLVFDRLEGKAPQAIAMTHSGEVSLVDLLSDLAVARAQHLRGEATDIDETQH